MVGKQRNTQILMYLPFTYVLGSTSSKAETLGFSTCKLRTWVRRRNYTRGRIIHHGVDELLI